jgi:Domain of unknown function (DUF4296)
MRTWVVVLFLLGVSAGCNHPDRVPRGILSKDSMQSIMWDIIRADQYASQFLARDSVKSNIRPQTIRLYQQVFELHGITREEFEKSYQFYLGHPDIARTMLDSLYARALRHRADALRQPPAPAVVNPSRGHPMNAR